MDNRRATCNAGIQRTRRSVSRLSILIGAALGVVVATGLTTAVSALEDQPAAVVTQSPAADTPIRVATYNICKVKCGSGPFAWEFRRLAMVRTVAEAAPDVLLVQEANTQKWRGIRQIDDVISLLAPLGYQIASASITGCTPGCSRGAHVFYRTSSMKLADMPGSAIGTAGMLGMSQVAATSLGPIQDRAVSWAFLSPIGSTRVALYVSVHLATQKTAVGEAARVAVASRLHAWTDAAIAASGASGVETVIGGDFNSYDTRQPNGAQRILADTGLYDGYTAPVLVNGDIGSVNVAPKIKKYKGFPPAPYRYRANTTHIDYVFSSVVPARHEVVVHLLPDGTFDNNYRASDHNMVAVDLPLR